MQNLVGVLLWAGVAAPIVYAATVVAGGASIPGYDHFADSISSLTQSGRQETSWIQSCFTLYNLLLAVFAGATLWRSREHTLWVWVFGLVLLTTICGLLMGPFAQDPVGTPVTWQGIAHLVLAAIESLSTLVVLSLSVIGFRARGVAAGFWVSLGCLLLTAPFGVATALAVGNSWPGVGLFERLTIGGFEAWLLIVAILLLARPHSLLRQPHPPRNAAPTRTAVASGR
ncbi:MAG: DUF998 domain-containing protein [Devosia sp.]